MVDGGLCIGLFAEASWDPLSGCLGEKDRRGGAAEVPNKHEKNWQGKKKLTVTGYAE